VIVPKYHVLISVKIEGDSDNYPAFHELLEERLEWRPLMRMVWSSAMDAASHDDAARMIRIVVRHAAWVAQVPGWEATMQVGDTPAVHFAHTDSN
jgi:hypothetical protein